MTESNHHALITLACVGASSPGISGNIRLTTDICSGIRHEQVVIG